MPARGSINPYKGRAIIYAQGEYSDRVPTKLKAKFCKGCNYHVPTLRWCRLLLEEAPGSCRAQMVTVGFTRSSPDARNNGRSARKRNAE